jgi:hypothetical protein
MDVKRLFLISALVFASVDISLAAEIGRALRVTTALNQSSTDSSEDHQVTILVAGAVERPEAVTLPAAEATVAGVLAAAGGASRESYRLSTLLLRRTGVDSDEAACMPLAARHASLLIQDDAKLGARTDLISQLLSGQLVRIAARDYLAGESGVPTLLLQEGDLLALPARSTVVYVATVQGRIVRLPHEPSAAAEIYLGQLPTVDRKGIDKVLLHYPSGQQIELALDPWRYRPTMIPPGSLIAPDSVCLLRE